MSPIPHYSIGTILYCTNSMLVCDITWAIEVVYCGEGEGKREKGKKQKKRARKESCRFLRYGGVVKALFLPALLCLLFCFFTIVVEMAREKQLVT